MAVYRPRSGAPAPPKIPFDIMWCRRGEIRAPHASAIFTGLMMRSGRF
jgi:hypothetical protein